MRTLKVGDKIRVGTGPDYRGYPAVVTKVIQRTHHIHGRPYEQYEVDWTIQGGKGHVDQIFCTDWKLEE